MHRLASVFLALALLAPGAQSQAMRNPAAERQLFKLEDDFSRAVIARDAKALKRLVAPGWVYSDESGVMARDPGIDAFVGGPDTVTASSNSGMRAMVYGTTAVVIGVLHMSGRGEHGTFNRRYRYTDTWVKLDGRWQCVASQDYLMPEGTP
ncbi:MAG: hypothetical protein JWO05_2214 [Gemmatimonadetes bacterium]|nr:hypothetical protein [Gemmatimonadota bacterium]